MSDAEPLDLAEFVAETLPQLVDAEAAEGWGGGSTSPPRPGTSLLAEDSPLTTFLNAPAEPPEGTGRSERREFLAERDAAELAAREAAQDALDDHAEWIKAIDRRRAADAFDALITSHREGGNAREANGLPAKGTGTRVTAEGPDQPAARGWW